MWRSRTMSDCPDTILAETKYARILFHFIAYRTSSLMQNVGCIRSSVLFTKQEQKQFGTQRNRLSFVIVRIQCVIASDKCRLTSSGCTRVTDRRQADDRPRYGEMCRYRRNRLLCKKRFLIIIVFFINYVFIIIRRVHVQLKELNHNNIKAFIGACVEPGHICYLTQACNRGTVQVRSKISPARTWGL